MVVYERGMTPPRVLLIDRSQLSANMFRLLLSPLSVELIAVCRFEEGRPFFFRHPAPAVALITSNSFGKKFSQYLNDFCDDETIARTPKIFLCKETAGEERWREILAGVSQGRVVVRPFDPAHMRDELAACLKRRGGQE